MFHKYCRENQNISFVISKFFFRKSCRVWANVENNVNPARPLTTIWAMRISCWVPKATNTHSEYVIIIAFPLQQWWHERASVLRNTHIVSLYVFLVLICRYRLWPNITKINHNETILLALDARSTEQEKAVKPRRSRKLKIWWCILQEIQVFIKCPTKETMDKTKFSDVFKD